MTKLLKFILKCLDILEIYKILSYIFLLCHQKYRLFNASKFYELKIQDLIFLNILLYLGKRSRINEFYVFIISLEETSIAFNVFLSSHSIPN